MQPNAANTAAPPLQLGDVVDGKVLIALVDGRIRVMLANTILELAGPGNLLPGTTLRLQVAGSAGALRFVVLDQVPPASTGDGALAAAASASGASASAVVDAASAQSASAPGNVAQPPETAATLAMAVATAATRQGSLAPLFANTALAATLDQLPASVRDAASQLLTLRSPLNGDLSAAVVKQAFTSSGLLLETRLALASQALAPPPSTSDDLKAALSAFRALLSGYLDTIAATPSKPSPSIGTPALATPVADQPAAAPSAPPASAPLDRSTPQVAQRAAVPATVTAPPLPGAIPAATPDKAVTAAKLPNTAPSAPPARAAPVATQEPLPEPAVTEQAPDQA